MNKEVQEFGVQEFGWWIEITTDKPRYIYYFGDFSTYWEALFLASEYRQDLEEEEAEVINIQIEKCQPEHLSICPESIYI